MKMLRKSLLSRLVRIVSLAVIAPTLISQSIANEIEKDYPVDQVSEHVYVVHGPSGLPNPENQGFMNNPGFVLTSEGVVVIDPGSSVYVGRMVLEKIASITDMPVVATFSTHIHGDHWLANQAIKEKYPDAKLYAHPDLIKQAQSGQAENWIDLMMRLTNGAIKGTKAVIPDLPVEDGDVISIGGVDFSIQHKGQAHTRNDIAILIDPDSVLITGDLVFNRRVGRMDEGRFQGSIETLEHLLTLNAKIVVPGHGQTADNTIVKNMLRLHRVIHQTVQEHYDSGLGDFEIKPFVVEQTKEFQDWGGYQDAIGRLVSLSYLEVEEENF